MRHALSEHFGLKQQAWVFSEIANAPPTINNLPEGHWLSLSHSRGFICFVLHNKPIGIDIERSKLRGNFYALADAFMNEGELELLNSNEQLIADNFYKIWCAKEAFYKMIPASDQEGMFLKKIDYLDLTNGKNSHLIQGYIEEHHLAIVTNAPLKTINLAQARTFDGSLTIQWD